MRISVTFRNTEGEDWFKNYVEEKLGKLKKYLDHPSEAHVVLSVEKFRNMVEINLTENGLTVNAKEEAKEMPAAIDEAVDKIERQLKKHRDKVRDHKSSVKQTAAEQSLRGEGGEDASRRIEVRKVILKPMSVEDAALELQTTKNHFVVYRDTATEAVCVLYTRDDDHLVLIETNS